jgi:hypothetical protein
MKELIKWYVVISVWLPDTVKVFLTLSDTNNKPKIRIRVEEETRKVIYASYSST